MQAEIQQEHIACCQKAVNAIGHAVAAGRVLLAAKQIIGHGDWLAWLDRNFSQTSGLTERTAQRYMKLAKQFLPATENSQPAADGKTTSTSDSLIALPDNLTLSGALRLVAAKEPNGQTSTTKPRAAKNIGTNEWLTPSNIVEASVNFLGSIDVDPAAAVGCQNIPAKKSYSRDADSLKPDTTWQGTALINPGFQGKLEPWIEKAADQYERQILTEGILLLPARTDAPWARRVASFPHAFLTGPCIVQHAQNDGTGKLPKPLMIVFIGPGNRFTDFATAFEAMADVFFPASSLKGQQQ